MYRYTCLNRSWYEFSESYCTKFIEETLCRSKIRSSLNVMFLHSLFPRFQHRISGTTTQFGKCTIARKLELITPWCRTCVIIISVDGMGAVRLQYKQCAMLKARHSRNEAQPSGGSRISPRWGRQLSGGGGAPTYDFVKISQKLHEIERIWTPGGPKIYYVDPPLQPPRVQLPAPGDVLKYWWFWHHQQSNEQ